MLLYNAETVNCCHQGASVCRSGKCIKKQDVVHGQCLLASFKTLGRPLLLLMQHACLRCGMDPITFQSLSQVVHMIIAALGPLETLQEPYRNTTELQGDHT